MIDLRDISANGSEIPFGLSTEKLAAKLRDLADQVDAGKVIPQKVELLHEAAHEDFLMSTLRMQFVERREP